MARGEKWGYECSPTPYGRKKCRPGGCGRKFHSLKDFDAHLIGKPGSLRRCALDRELEAAGVPFLPPQVRSGAT